MNNKIFVLLMILAFVMGVISVLLIINYAEQKMMGEYDLYNCIYNNADSNNFPQNPIMIKKIQDECICFREHNFTNLLEADC